MEKKKVKYCENLTKGNSLEILCNSCERKTSHIILSSINEDGDLEYDENCSISWNNSFQIIQCEGCKSISFRETNYFSEEVYFPDEDPTRIYLYPERTINLKKTIDTLNFPTDVGRIYRETIDAFNNESLILCAAGLRAIVEITCISLGVKGGNVFINNKEEFKDTLEGKINGLVAHKHLTQSAAQILHKHRFMGNKAIHQIKPPLKMDLLNAIEIFEHFLEHIYDLPIKASLLPSK